ncbi:MAG: FAD-dependent oxidoreductase [Acidobacteria bacterium]|nr:FAD-dependent oxidoreductase [Acidobacteriota bacterium]
MSDAPASRVLIVGAGVAGLTAARALEGLGVSIVAIDKGRGVGGRIATRRLSDGEAYDHGALRFAAADGPVGSLVSTWEAEGIVARVSGEGPARWRIAGPTTRLPKKLAEGLDVQTGVRAVALRRRGGGLEVNLEDGRSLTASAAIVTCPVPQALALLDAGGLTSEAPESLLSELRRVTYEPGLVLLLRLDRRVDGFPGDGLIRLQGGGAVSRILENAAPAGTGPSRLSVYARGAFARDAFDWPDADVVDALLAAARRELASLSGAVVAESELKRWRFARAESPAAELAPAFASSGAPVILCGDAFGPPEARNPEGGADGIARAVRSGLAAAARLGREFRR